MKSKPSYSGHADQRFGHQTFSQRGEDLFALSVFELLGIETPNYLDIGANHPIHSSNTYLMHLRGSRGICVEPSITLSHEYAKHRPETLLFGEGICAKGDASYNVPFYVFGDGSGRNTTDKAVAEAYQTATQSQYRIGSIAVTPAKLLLNAWHEYGFEGIDFLDIDTEGEDLEILRAVIDYYDPEGSKSKAERQLMPKLVCVELKAPMQVRQAQVRMFEDERGYKACGFMGDNVFFIREDLYSTLERGRGVI